MRLILRFFLVLILSAYKQEYVWAQWIYQDFDIAMKCKDFKSAIDRTSSIVGIEGNILYTFFKSLYVKNNISTQTVGRSVKIPKIIHQIWLGSPIPDAFKKYMQSWTQHHCGDDWEYILWDEEKIKSLSLYNQKFYQMSTNWGQKSDIARWEILYQYGGLYVDVDFECLIPFDILHTTYDFYVGIQPLDSHFLQLNNALVGSRAGHPIIKHCIATIKDDWHIFKGAPQTTGPVHFTRSFYARAHSTRYTNIALPAFYFYPLGTQDTVIDKEKWISNGAFAIHWWAKTWMPKKYRRHAFRSINNEISTLSWND